MRAAICTAVLLALSPLSVAFADDQAAGAKPDREARRAEFMKKFDKDGDGKLSDEERAAVREQFGRRGEGRRRPEAGREELMKKFDKDGDGQLSEEERGELRKHFEELRANRPEGERPRRRGGFDREAVTKEFDKDGDGQLNDEERAAAREAMRKRFEERRGEGQPRGPRGEGRRGRRPGPPAE